MAQVVRKKLQDVLARHAGLRPVARRPEGHTGRRTRRRHFSILAQALEHGFAQQGVLGQCAVGDLGVEHRLHPGRIRLLDRFGERGVFAYEWIEPLAQVARHGFGVAAAHLPA
jgi:hypothetical protein